MTAAPLQPNASASDREMLVELVQLHARALLRMPWVQMALVVGVWLFVHAFVPLPMFVGWGVLTIGVEAARARYAARVLRADESIDAKQVHVRFVLLAVLAGTGVSVGAMLFLPHLPILHQALFGAILFAI